MKKNIFTLFFITALFSSQISWACDLLSIDIGSNKSTIENIFGTFEEEQSQIEEVIGTTRGTGSSGLAGEVFVYFSEINKNLTGQSDRSSSSSCANNFF